MAIWLLCGPLSVHYGLSTSLILAGVFVTAAVLFDGLDGAAARWLGQETTFGRCLDAGCDVVSFVVTPLAASIYVFDAATMLWRWLSLSDFLFHGCLALYAFAAARRLAISAVKGPSRESSFCGLPVPAAAFLVMTAAIWIALRCDPVRIEGRSIAHAVPLVTDQSLIWILDATLLLSAVAMLIPIPIPHPIRRLQGPRESGDASPDPLPG